MTYLVGLAFSLPNRQISAPTQGSNRDPIICKCLPQSSMPLFQTSYSFPQFFEGQLLMKWSSKFSWHFTGLKQWRNGLSVYSTLQCIKEHTNIMFSFHIKHAFYGIASLPFWNVACPIFEAETPHFALWPTNIQYGWNQHKSKAISVNWYTKITHVTSTLPKYIDTWKWECVLYWWMK